MSNLTRSDIREGAQYRVIGNENGHHFAIGSVITATADGSDAFKGTDIDGSTDAVWFLWPSEVEVATPVRPLIDFSGSSRATAREYASRHVSKVNKTETNTILGTVAAGGEVDAYALNEALLDAMRGATTRAGQSPLRRVHGREIAYLGHITQAVIEAHADGLPVYADTGVRSRKIETLEGEIAALQTAGQDVVRMLDESKAEADDLKLQVATLADERYAAQSSEATARALLADAQSALATAEAALNFAGGLLDAGQYAEVVGFRQGFAVGRQA